MVVWPIVEFFANIALAAILPLALIGFVIALVALFKTVFLDW